MRDKVKTKFNKNIIKVLCLSMLCTMGNPKNAYAEEMLNQSEEPSEEREITHGTALEWITEDMINNTPPADYVVNKATQGDAKDGAYNTYFLKDEIQTVSIEIDENNLNYLLQNAIDEPYVMADSVTIGDVTLGYPGLRTKGSFTLEHSVTDNAGSDRFSFTVNFGKYIKKKDYGSRQNFFGCDKISFNNFFFDKTMMKEFFALKLLDEMGLPTPQYGIAKLYINGEYYGVYAMVEAMDHSILEQYYGVDKDELSSYLCKPEGTRFLQEEIDADASPLWENDEDTLKDVEDMLPTVTEWVRRINLLSNGMNFEGTAIDVNSEEYLQLVNQVLDTDEVVKYFAVHSWLCQIDNMFDGQKNFGLYVDADGCALMVPWDYDLSFGCFYPSTAENTANYPLDVMYKLDYWRAGEEAEQSAEVYKSFPLFHIIYQNDALMEKFHSYMKECSKVVLLGGTVTSTGKTYEPGYFYSFLEKMQEDVIAAASEKLADNVYYMNGIRQPSGAKKGIPNLAKILAYRSVGVVNQVDGVDAMVSTYGCDLSTLGNAIKGESAKKGTLTAVDVATGIYATASYGGGKNSSAPVLEVTELTEEDGIYGMFWEELRCGAEDMMVVYHMDNKGTPTTNYTLTVPMTQQLMQAPGEFRFYTHIDGALTEFSMTAEDNLYTGEVAAIDYIVVVKSTGESAEEKDTATLGNQKEEAPDTVKAEKQKDSVAVSPVIIVFGAVILVLVVIVLVVARKKKEKK